MQNTDILNAIQSKIIQALDKDMETVYDYCDLKRCMYDYLYLTSRKFNALSPTSTYQNCIGHYINGVSKADCKTVSCSDCWRKYLLRKEDNEE